MPNKGNPERPVVVLTAYRVCGTIVLVHAFARRVNTVKYGGRACSVTIAILSRCQSDPVLKSDLNVRNDRFGRAHME